MKTKKEGLFIILIILLSVVGLTVAFASISTALRISGSAYLRASTWDIQLKTPTNFLFSSGGKFLDSPLGGPVEGEPSISGTTIYFQTELTTKGDYVKFDIPIKNNGTIDSKLDNIVNNITGVDSNLLEVLLTNQNGEVLTNNLVLDKGETKTISIMIRYKNDAIVVPTGDEVSISVTLLWIQK